MHNRKITPLVLLLALLLGCAKDRGKEPADVITVTDFGEAHNQGLDYVYWKLQGVVQKQGRAPSDLDILRFSEAFMREHIGWKDDIPMKQTEAPSLFHTRWMGALEGLHFKTKATEEQYRSLAGSWLARAQNQQDSLLVLSTAQVAAGSTRYWETNMDRWRMLAKRIKNLDPTPTQQNGQGGQQDEDPGERRRKEAEAAEIENGKLVKDIAWDDVKGMAAGFLTGAVRYVQIGSRVGMFIPGIGHVVMGSTFIIAGGLTGAIGRSAGTALDDLIGNPFQQ